MTSATHRQHLASRVSHNDCSECRADTERRFVTVQPWSYQHVADYLSWTKPRLAAIHAGAMEVNARIWHRQFLAALHRRITLKAAVPVARRKDCASYLERLRQHWDIYSRKWRPSERYLRAFSRRGASCLDR